MCRAAFPSLGMKTRNELLALTAVTRAVELMLAVVNHAAVPAQLTHPALAKSRNPNAPVRALRPRRVSGAIGPGWPVRHRLLPPAPVSSPCFADLLTYPVQGLLGLLLVFSP